MINAETETAPYIIRDAAETDLGACLAIDHSCTTDYAWQVEMQNAGEGRITITFNKVRLPRPARLVYPRAPELANTAWKQRDCFLVATIDEQLRGYLNMRADAAHGHGQVIDIAVDPTWRRRGIGGALLKVARAWAREHKLSRIVVETHTKNYPGICFCQKYGLAFCGFNDQYYPNQDIALFFAGAVR